MSPPKSAVIATLIECCKLNAINPHKWLTQTLARLANGHHANRVGELMPWTAVGWPLCIIRTQIHGRLRVVR